MAEESFYNFINNNPLYVHNKLEPFLSAANQINNDISFDFLFKTVIGELKTQENKIYKYLSFGEGQGEEGQIKIGKQRLEKLSEEIYSNNNNRKKIFQYMQQLFGKVDSNGNPLTIQSAKSELPIGVNYQQRVSKNSNGPKFIGEWTVKKGTKKLKENSIEAQQIVTKFCDNWNSFIQDYTSILKLIQDCIQEGTIDIETGKRFESFRTFLLNAQKELSKGSSVNYSNFTTLGDNFNQVIRERVGQWGDIIGFFNEVCKFELDENIDERIKRGFTFRRGDDISSEEKGSESEFAKADNIIQINGTLENPDITIPVSLKFSSTERTKIQTSSLRSVVNKISNEPEGGEYANYLKYLLINNAYFGIDNKIINSTITKILQRYIYLFFSGGLNDSLKAKALFMSSTLIGDDGYSSHFFSIASFLENLKKKIEDNEKILEWDALKVTGFSVNIKTAIDFLSQASASKQLLRTTKESREKYNYTYGIIAKDDNVREVDIEIFDKLSSLVKTKGIFIKNKYIIDNLPRTL